MLGHNSDLKWIASRSFRSEVELSMCASLAAWALGSSANKIKRLECSSVPFAEVGTRTRVGHSRVIK